MNELAKVMEMSVHDSENYLTFDVWFKKYEDISDVESPYLDENITDAVTVLYAGLREQGRYTSELLLRHPTNL